MRILIFGKNGQVARCLREEAGGTAATALGSDDCDLIKPGAAAKAITQHAPDIVVNAAAYTAVDKAETDEATARRLNAEAPAEIAAACADAGARFIHVSTDYVFDGQKDTPYAEDDAPAPLGVYGATKRDGENAVLTAAPGAIILRTSWVFSEYGANFVKTMLRLGNEQRGLSIVDDQIGGPTPARDIARAIMTIAGKIHRGAPGDGVYHYQGEPPVSWAAFAEKIFEVTGLPVEVKKISTPDYPTAAARPLYTVLDCARIARNFGIAQTDWRIGLRQTLGALTEKRANP
jgi:dTDP-4-dehydrorhamnose reductase